MTDRKALPESNEPPEDVAMLYSWANLHGAKYRDFSASRAQSREKTRQRAQQSSEEGQELAQQAFEEQRERMRQETELYGAEEARRTAEMALVEERIRQAEINAQQAAEQAAQLAANQAAQHAAQEAAQLAAQRAAQEAAQRAAQQAAQEIARRAAEQAAAEARAAQAQAAQHAEAVRAAQQAAQQATWQQPVSERFTTAAPHAPPQPSQAAQQPASHASQQPAPQVPQPARHTANYPAAPAFRQTSVVPQPPPISPAQAREDLPAQSVRSPWATPETRDLPLRPAWLAERPQPLAAAPQTPNDTIQGSRERLTSRWFALKGVFEGSPPVVDTAPAQPTARAPVVAVFSLAGGVGKTSMVATLGRALSSRGERVVLVDTTAFGLLPFFFGARDRRPGQLRTFNPPATSGDAAVQMVAIDPEVPGSENSAQEPLIAEIQKYSQGVSRVIVDLATASGSTTLRILKMAPLVLVPVVPDMNSVVSVGSIDAFFEHNSSVAGKTLLPYYVLNQFDPSLPLHLDVREVLREQLGERLLPFALRRAPAVSEALAEGMTVMDYAPNSTIAEDFGSLAGWVKSQSAPASSGFRGVRWSER